MKHLPFAILALTALTLLTPLVVAPDSFTFPFVVPKVLYFRSLVEVMLALWLVLAALRWRTYGLRLTPITVALAIFFASLVVSTIAGVDWRRSVWDSSGRMLGVFSLLHYGAFFVIVASVAKGWRSWRLIFAGVLAVGAVVAGIGIAQKLDPDLLLNHGNPRVSSTLGNANYLGGFGVLLAFLGLLVAVRRERIWLRALAALAGLLGVCAIAISVTRSAAIGAAAGIAVLGVCAMILLERGSRLRLAMQVVLALGLIGAGTLLALHDSELVKSIPTLRRFTDFDPEEGSARIRILAWGIAAEAAEDRPVLGWGPANFYFASNAHHDPELLYHGVESTWVDNAHNIVLDTLAVQGLAGVLCLLVLAVTPIAGLWIGVRRGRIDRPLACILTALLAAHFVHLSFSFEDATSYLIIVLLLAFADSELHRDAAAAGEPDERPALPRPAFALLLGLALGGAAAAVWLANVVEVMSSRAAFTAVQSVHRGDHRLALALLDEATSCRSPQREEARELFASAVLKRLEDYVRAKRPDVARALAERSYEELGKNLALHPLDVHAMIVRGKLANAVSGRLGVHDLASRSLAELARARELSPRRQEVLYVRSGLALHLQRGDESVRMLEDAIAIDPGNGESWWRLAVAQDGLGRKEEARATIAEARRRGVKLSAHGRALAERILPEAPPDPPPGH